MQQEDIDVNSLLQEVTQKPVTNTEETSKETSENISYDALLQGEAKLQTLDGKSVSLAELAGNSDVNYVIMDLDKDGEDELFILASPVSALIKNIDGEYKMIYDDIDWKTINATASLDTEGQLEILEKEAAVWQLSEEAHGDFTEATDFANYGFAVTDLDNDGMLEVIKSGWAGTGHYSMNYIYEVTAEGTLEAIDTSALEEMKSQPDLFMEGIRTAGNADKNTYIVIDMEYGAGSSYTYYEMRMENNKISLSPCQEPQDVDALLDNAFWFKDITADNLKESYEGFAKSMTSAANTSDGNTLSAKVHNDYFLQKALKNIPTK